MEKDNTIPETPRERFLRELRELLSDDFPDDDELLDMTVQLREKASQMLLKRPDAITRFLLWLN